MPRRSRGSSGKPKLCRIEAELAAWLEAAQRLSLWFAIRRLKCFAKFKKAIRLSLKILRDRFAN